jgi:hypothetical protein
MGLLFESEDNKVFSLVSSLLFFNKHPGKNFKIDFHFLNQSKHGNWLVLQSIRSRVRFLKRKSWILIKIWNRIDQRFFAADFPNFLSRFKFYGFSFFILCALLAIFTANFEFDFFVDFQNRWIANLKISIKIFYVEIIGWKIHDFF